MFILYSVLIGLVVGLLLGGQLSGLARIQFRWAWVVFVAFLIQVVLFSEPVAARIGAVGPVLYVGSTVMAVVAIATNIRLTGIPLVVLGAVSNLAAILANGGYMPASGDALRAIEKWSPDVYSNSSIVANPALEPLTDIFVLPAWLPFTNIFSIGDVIIGLGVVVAIVAAMRRRGDPAPELQPA